jgi:hypothetical protein
LKIEAYNAVMSKESDQAAYDDMVAELKAAGADVRDADYVVDAVMAIYKRMRKQAGETGEEIYEAIRDDLESRGLGRLIDPVVKVAKKYISAIERGNNGPNPAASLAPHSPKHNPRSPPASPE